jgi:lipopolysaccharide biosynthesis protein
MDKVYESLSHSMLAGVSEKLEIGEEYFWVPDRLAPFEHWIGHIPFAFWLVKALRPHRIVELGTHRGNSYCAMCQAVSTLNLSTQAFAVDTWQGDIHMATELGLLEELRSYHDPRYADFSTLLPMTFDAARQIIDDNSIDLLHIDGTHTYDSVRHDFETWKSALSSRAVVLFHDTCVRRDDYGVWRLWKELSSQYPSFEFLHSHGLGVLGIGDRQAPLLQELFDASKDEASAHWIRLLFASRGDLHVARYISSEAGRSRLDLEARLKNAAGSESSLRAQLESVEKTAAGKAAEFSDIEATLQARLEDAERTAADKAAAFSEQEAIFQARLTEAEEALKRRATEMSAALKAERDSAQIRETALRGTLKKNLDAVKTLDAAKKTLTVEQSRLQAIETSTLWQVSQRVARALNYVPPPCRTAARRTLKAGWWTVTGQLPRRLQNRKTSPSLAAATRAPLIANTPVATRGALTSREITLPDLSSCRTAQPKSRLAVVIHVHFPDLWREIEDALSAIPETYDLFVSLTKEAGDAIIDVIRERHPTAQLHIFPNHGRDSLPFLAFAQTGALNNYQLVLKLHTKRSLHRVDGDDWRQTLVNGILGSTENVQQIITAFENDPDLGIVVADNNICGDDPGHWNGNLTRLSDLGRRIGIVEVPPGACFPGGSMYWIRPFLLRTLAGLNVSSADFEREPIALDGSAAHAVERLVGLVCQDAGMTVKTFTEVMSFSVEDTKAPDASDVSLIAFYLPQFHPTQENDQWWGKGFTEWTNVTRGRPSFPDHRQPRLPADLGFYDLRLPEARQEQAAMAAQYGVDAFCYYYYWFDNGRGALRRPLDDMLASGKPDFPFLICWANEPWTRNWDGGNREVLLPQTYREDWPIAFARDIAPVLRDPRYFRRNGIPVLLIYRVMHIPHRDIAFAQLREELRRNGVGEIHLAGGWLALGDDERVPADPYQLGLDAYFEFPPHGIELTNITDQIKGITPEFSGAIYNYDSAINSSLALTPDADTRHRAVMLGWDNTARQMLKAQIVHGATPAKLRRWLRELLRLERARTGNRLVFINAWNEWAEGSTLEPDRDFGHGWLEAVASARSEPILPRETP